MKDVAVHEPARPLPASDSSFPIAEGLRQRAANFWLGLFFAAARDLPWMVRGFKPFFIWGAVTVSRQIRNATAANARRIYGKDVTAGQITRFTRDVTASFYDFVADVGYALRLTPKQMYERVASADHEARYHNIRAQKRGAIVVTAHMGSFEVGLAALRQTEEKVHVVFRRDPADRFDQIRQLLRQRLGVIEAPVQEGWGLWMRLRDALLANEVVVLQGDRVMPGQKGQRVPFLNHHIMLPTGPVKLAQASGAPLVPIFSLRQPDGRIRIVVEEPIEVAAHDEVDPMDKLARVLEKHVREHPEQWLMFHPAFCEDEDTADRGEA